MAETRDSTAPVASCDRPSASMQSALYCCASGTCTGCEQRQRLLVCGGVVERLGLRQRFLGSGRRA